MNTKYNQKGFTLIETIIALAIITVVATSFYRATFSAMAAGNNNRERHNQLILCKNVLEDIRAYRDENSFKNFEELKALLLSLGYSLESEESLVKSVLYNNVYYTLEVTLREEGESLISVIVRVKSNRNLSVELGTKYFISSIGGVPYDTVPNA